MTVRRRALLLSLAAIPWPRAARAARWLPEPRLTDERVLRQVAGVRPYRTGGVRIEREQRDGKTIVHNYGHGGAGVTLCWGSAEEAAALLPPEVRGPVAVAGAGVIGLATALVLAERGRDVRVYARAQTPHTTSDLAGAEWSPDLVDPGPGPVAQERFARLIRRSWRRFSALVGPRWGVRRRTSFQADGVPSALDGIPSGLLPPGRQLARLPFARAAHPGIAYQTFLVEPPRFMPALVAAFGRKGGTIVPRTFATAQDLLALPEAAVFNCLGLGAGAVVGDGALVPVKGQLVHLRPERLPYLLNHPGGYVFPRADALVLGGSFEQGRLDTNIDPQVGAGILAANRRFFAGG
jgi:glycine/D-amino acid oxidase-like deaminating enzyme